MAQDTPETLRATWSQAKRDAYFASHPENFAGPDGSYPIEDSSDVKDAWNLAGHAANPDVVRSKIKSIAKRLGFEDSLPDTASDEDRAAAPTTSHAVFTDHPPFEGTHTHAHPDADGTMHEHEHTHHNDNHHTHQHPTYGDVPERTTMPTTAHLYAPITRIDNDKREVEGVATSESVDTFGTIFSYDASKKAFQRWIDRTSNVREMHERKAVGKGIGVFFDDAAKQVIVRTRVSMGAPDTWVKIQEGVLNGYSVGATNPTWSTVTRDGKAYPYLINYDLTELSYVDNASNPDSHGLVIARADSLDTSIIDVTESQPTFPPLVERAGARLSADSMDAIHKARDASIKNAMGLMQHCNCPACKTACDQLDPDGDGDIDGLGGLADPDGDASKNSNMEERITTILEHALAPIYSRQQQFLARLAQYNPDTTALEQRFAATTDIMKAALEQVASTSSLDEVRLLVSEVKDQVERIAAQPASGGPIMNGAYPIDKRLATQPTLPSGPSYGEKIAFLNGAQAAGGLTAPEDQTRAAAQAIIAMRGRMSQ